MHTLLMYIRMFLFSIHRSEQLPLLLPAFHYSNCWLTISALKEEAAFLFMPEVDQVPLM